MTMGAADNSDNGLVDNPIPGVCICGRSEGGSRARGTRMLVLVGGHSPTIDTLCANEGGEQANITVGWCASLISFIQVHGLRCRSDCLTLLPHRSFYICSVDYSIAYKSNHTKYVQVIFLNVQQGRRRNYHSQNRCRKFTWRILLHLKFPTTNCICFWFTIVTHFRELRKHLTLVQGDPCRWWKPPVDLDLRCSAILPGQ